MDQIIQILNAAQWTVPFLVACAIMLSRTECPPTPQKAAVNIQKWWRRRRQVVQYKILGGRVLTIKRQNVKDNNRTVMVEYAGQTIYFDHWYPRYDAPFDEDYGGLPYVNIYHIDKILNKNTERAIFASLSIFELPRENWWRRNRASPMHITVSGHFAKDNEIFFNEMGFKKDSLPGAPCNMKGMFHNVCALGNVHAITRFQAILRGHISRKRRRRKN